MDIHEWRQKESWYAEQFGLMVVDSIRAGEWDAEHGGPKRALELAITAGRNALDETDFHVEIDDDGSKGTLKVIGPAGTFEIPFVWWLASSQGAGFLLKPSKAVPADYVGAAKKAIRRRNDVVSMSVEREG